jgi:hypothetical protein
MVATIWVAVPDTMAAGVTLVVIRAIELPASVNHSAPSGPVSEFRQPQARQSCV